MSILQDLYNGEIFPAEKINPTDPEYHTLGEEIKTEKEHMAEKLSPEDNLRLDRLFDCIMAQSVIYAYANFAYGFKLGVRLMQEVIADSGEMD